MPNIRTVYMFCPVNVNVIFFCMSMSICTARVHSTFDETCSWRFFPRLGGLALTRCAQYLCVAMPPALGSTLLRQMDTGSLTCASFFRCVPYIRKGRAGGHRQVCTRVDSEGQKPDCPHPAPPGNRTQGLRVRKSGALTTELRPPATALKFDTE